MSGQVVMRTLSDSQLAVSLYPRFSYNTLGGGGVAEATPGPDGKVQLRFNPATVRIPAVDSSTTTVLGLPLPGIFKIQIQPRRLEGWLDRSTGIVELMFDAEFNFTASSMYAAPPLVVHTVLTTESAKGRLQENRGSRMDANGYARLVGVAEVPLTTDAFINRFLMLPTDALAVMSAQFSFPS